MDGESEPETIAGFVWTEIFQCGFSHPGFVWTIFDSSLLRVSYSQSDTTASLEARDLEAIRLAS